MEQEDAKTRRFGDGSEAVIGACSPSTRRSYSRTFD
jgi:hypothetical protein